VAVLGNAKLRFFEPYALPQHVARISGLVVQSSNGSRASRVGTGFDTTASVVTPPALWVRVHDVYVAGSKAITLPMTR
jgi:hypothetical protein